MLYYTFAALQGYRPAEMAMGYRHWAGIGVKEVSQDVIHRIGRILMLRTVFWRLIGTRQPHNEVCIPSAWPLGIAHSVAIKQLANQAMDGPPPQPA